MLRRVLCRLVPTGLVVVAMASMFAGCGDGSSSSSGGEVFAPQEGEIFLEPAGTAGPEPFAGEIFVSGGSNTTLQIPTTSTLLVPVVTSARPEVQQVISYAADTPALYGGSKSKARCDKEGQIRFLEQNPDKAAAFCAALNSDPTLRWSGGTQVRPDQLRDYFSELTPVILTRDTRVTNHGFRDGRPTPRQSVLQAGQAVLVDGYGVPRVRCECGNPLIPPKPAATRPRYTGPRWPGFDPTVIIVVQQSTIIIDVFVLVDVVTGRIFSRPAGTTGAEDAVKQATSWTLTVELAYQWGEFEWTVDISVNPDGTLGGIGPSVWHANGYTWTDSPDNRTGTWTAEIYCSAMATGTLDTTEMGRILRITPVPGTVTWTDLVIVDNIGPNDQQRTDIESQIPGWMAGFFVSMDLPAVDSGTSVEPVPIGEEQAYATLTAR